MECENSEEILQYNIMWGRENDVILDEVVRDEVVRDEDSEVAG